MAGAPAEDREAAGAIATDFACAFCGYNLRTQALRGRCPECGRGVRETVRYLRARRRRLHLEPTAGYRAWLWRLRFACLLMLLVPLGLIPFSGGPREDYRSVHGFVAWILGCAAMWLLAGRPAVRSMGRSATAMRTGLRLCAVAAVPLPAVIETCRDWYLYPDVPKHVLAVVVCYAMNVASAVGCVLFFAYLARVMWRMFRPMAAMVLEISCVLIGVWTVAALVTYPFALPPPGGSFHGSLNHGESLSPWMTEMLYRLPGRTDLVQPTGVLADRLDSLAGQCLVCSIVALLAARRGLGQALRGPRRQRVDGIAGAKGGTAGAGGWWAVASGWWLER